MQYGIEAEGESLPLLECRKFTAASGSSSGVMFNAGVPVWGLDWAAGSQHVAVSTCASDPAMGSRTTTPGSIQIWSAGGQCQVFLCTEAEVCAVKWMPVGVKDLNTLGVLAAAQLDGSVCVYAVPKPGPERVYIKAEPMVRIEVDDATAMCLDWVSGGRLTVGFSNALKEGDQTPLPDTYTPVALAAISAIHVARVPPVDSEGEPDYASDPYLVVFSSYDGSTGLLDLRDPAGTITFCRSRIPCSSVSWSPQNAAPLYIDSDYMVVMAQLRNASNPGTFILAPNRGPVLGLGCSDYHPMVAAAAADGGLTISSAATGFFRRKGVGLFYVRLYEVDYDEKIDTDPERTLKGTIRITDAFLPDHSTIEATNKRKDENRDDAAVKTAAWDREVGLHRAVWQNANGIKHAGWLASGGYAGIVRIEEVRGARLWPHEQAR
ncbi:hypothetical protein A1Q2_00592 [Trichosporon asahii var. asahii CBS 8904]|uniref:Uncharacterized protein n=1 Tax=Trichosporon asahii var. asahii (strain CBS 8904) TaxID=1220162 RepID=K1VX91_TRIAC|nr:hypothetical protein A1Q2_00592 [Trichosporon asahii var. asahii CBS 8904]